MKISGTEGPDKAFGRIVDQNQNSSEEKAKLKKASLSQDRIEISSEVGLYAKLYKAVKSEPEIRLSKVRELQQKLDNDSYKIDDRMLAEKILEDMAPEEA